jgi:hypothetical protein
MFPHIPSTSDTGAVRQLVANTGPVYPGGRDTVGTLATGFRLTDFVTTSFISDYDYFRVDKVEYFATVSNMPKSDGCNLIVYSSIDYDNANQPTFDELIKRPNRNVIALTNASPSQKLVDFCPRRRISSNVDPSQQIVTKPGEWLDTAYAASFIFGNLKLGVLAPDGQQQYPVSDQASVLITATVWVSFRGRVGA